MGFWADTVWFFHGWSHYTRAGFDKAYQNFDKNALNVDLTGKVYIVTGTQYKKNINVIIRCK